MASRRGSEVGTASLPRAPSSRHLADSHRGKISGSARVSAHYRIGTIAPDLQCNPPISVNVMAFSATLGQPLV